MADQVDGLGDRIRRAASRTAGEVRHHAENISQKAHEYGQETEYRYIDAKSTYNYEKRKDKEARKERRKYAPIARRLQNGTYTLGFGHHPRMAMKPEHSNPNLRNKTYTQKDVEAIVRYQQNERNMPKPHKHLKRGRFPNPYALR